MAIAQGNMALAEKILHIYKGDVNVNRMDNWNIQIGEPALVFKSKKAAQERYEEAFGKEEKEEVKAEEAQNTLKETKKNRRR